MPGWAASYFVAAKNKYGILAQETAEKHIGQGSQLLYKTQYDNSSS